MFWGFGNGGGSVISGALYHGYGPVVAFRIFAIASGILTLYLIITTKISDKLDIPDLTNLEAVCYTSSEKVKPSKEEEEDITSFNDFELESLNDEPLSYLQKKQ